MLEALKRRVLLPLIMAATTIATPATAQQAKNWSIPPGCQVTFVLRTTALVVDASWVADASIIHSYDLRHSCPAQPIKIDDLWLSSVVLDVLKIKDLGHRRNHPDWLLHIRASPTEKDKPATQPAPADRIRGQPINASIEMRTFTIVKRAREYDVQYLSSDPTIAGEAKISCGDDPVNRICHGLGVRFAGLMVNYNISQDQFPAPSEVSTDPNTEPGAILQFDQRLREWLIDLERPR